MNADKNQIDKYLSFKMKQNHQNGHRGEASIGKHCDNTTKSSSIKCNKKRNKPRISKSSASSRIRSPTYGELEIMSLAH